MATPYDVIGNVVDSNDTAIKDVIVSDGIQNIKTDADGYYEITTEKRDLRFKKSGFEDGAFNLGKYKLGAKVNADVTLKSISKELESGNFFTKNKKTIMYVGIGLVVVIGGFYAYKKFGKK
jgi:hypothetical protein